MTARRIFVVIALALLAAPAVAQTVTPIGVSAITSDRAAEMLNVSDRSVDRAPLPLEANPPAAFRHRGLTGCPPCGDPHPLEEGACEELHQP